MNITMENVTKRIKGETVLDHVSLELRSRNIYGIYGRNGSGKTMLLRCLSGIVKINDGKIVCDGGVLHQDMDILPNMGLLIENISFWKMYSGLENLKMLAAIRGVADQNKICETMQRVGLDPFLKKSVRKYSLGMRQKLAVCQAIMEEPDILLLDEPTNALDETGMETFRKIMLEEKERGALIVIASHNKDDIALLADKKLHMADGHLEEIS